jgi:hypothetical protein
VLKDTAEAGGDTAYVVGVPSRVDMHAFIAAPRDTDLSDGGTAQSHRDAHPNAGLQSCKAETLNLSQFVARKN